MMFGRFKKIKFGLFEIIISVFFLLIFVSLYFFLFRTKKDLVVIVKTNEESIVRWPWENIVDSNKVWNTPVLLHNLFQPGMKEKDALGRTSAELLSIRKYDNRPESPTVYLTLKLNTVFSPGSKIHVYKGKNVLVGSQIQLYLNNIFVNAIIVKVDDASVTPPLKKLSITASLTSPEDPGVLPYLADSISQGTEIKDNLGKTILTIVKKDQSPAQKIVTTDQGELVLATDPFRKDVLLTLDVWGYEAGDRYYFFDNIPLLVGEKIPIHLPNLSIYPKITSLLKAE